MLRWRERWGKLTVQKLSLCREAILRYPVRQYSFMYRARKHEYIDEEWNNKCNSPSANRVTATSYLLRTMRPRVLELRISCLLDKVLFKLRISKGIIWRFWEGSKEGSEGRHLGLEIPWKKAVITSTNPDGRSLRKIFDVWNYPFVDLPLSVL